MTKATLANDEEKLTPRQRRAIICLIQNVTVTAAAQESGVSEATLYRWLSDSSFKIEFRKQRRMLFERAVGLAQRASATAIATAVEIMQNSENDFARLAAARVVLDLARASDVEERLTALEEQLSAGDGEGSQLQLRRAS
jgi:phage terminase small subunit